MLSEVRQVQRLIQLYKQNCVGRREGGREKERGEEGRGRGKEGVGRGKALRGGIDGLETSAFSRSPQAVIITLIITEKKLYMKTSMVSRS